MFRALALILQSEWRGAIAEKSSSQIFHGGNSTFINSFDKTNFFFHSPTDAAPQFLQKLENLLLMQML